MYPNQQMPQPQAAPMPGQGGASQMDPRMLEMLIQQQQAALQQPAMQRQFKLAEQLRADQRGGLQGIQAGRRYVGPGIANLAGNIGQSLMAANLQGKGEAASKDFADKSGGALADVMKYWRGMQQPGMQPQQPFMGGGGVASPF